MSQIMKSFFALFMILFLLVISSSILSGFLTVMAAQNMHSQIVYNLESSNYDRQVISSCEKQAKDSGYRIDLTAYYEDKSSGKYQDSQKQIVMMKVDLGYYFKVGVFDISDEHIISGYAR